MSTTDKSVAIVSNRRDPWGLHEIPSPRRLVGTQDAQVHGLVVSGGLWEPLQHPVVTQ